jgi:hypothetical protein
VESKKSFSPLKPSPAPLNINVKPLLPSPKKIQPPKIISNSKVQEDEEETRDKVNEIFDQYDSAPE